MEIGLWIYFLNTSWGGGGGGKTGKKGLAIAEMGPKQIS